MLISCLFVGHSSSNLHYFNEYEIKVQLVILNFKNSYRVIIVEIYRNFLTYNLIFASHNCQFY